MLGTIPVPLISLSVITILDLIITICLFKFLKSTALIKNPKYEAGGALAGFVIVFGLLTVAYNEMLSHEPQLWDINGPSGTIALEDSSLVTDFSSDVSITYRPPDPIITVYPDGGFSMRNVTVIPGRGFPDLAFECVGHLSQAYRIDDDTGNPSQNDIIDRANKTIELARTVQLNKIPYNEEDFE